MKPGLSRRSMLHAGTSAVLSSSWVRTARADESGTLTVGLSNNPLTCDPINMSSHDTEIISQSIFENLVEFDIEGNLKPQLAKALPEISADSLVYTFELRDDVSFSNGQALTSDDVKYSIEYTIDPANKASRGPIFNRLSHVETDGPHRLHVHLKEPFAPWTAFLTKFMGVWPKGSREKYGPDYFRLTPKDVGTGPGIFEEWKPNDYVSLRRNPNYWQKGLPHWDRLVIKVVVEDATRVAFLLSGQADIIGAPPPREFSRLKSRKGIQGGSVATFGGWTVMLQNPTRPPFDDVEFRLEPSPTPSIARPSPRRFTTAWSNRPPSRPRLPVGGTTRKPTRCRRTTWIWRAPIWRNRVMRAAPSSTWSCRPNPTCWTPRTQRCSSRRSWPS